MSPDTERTEKILMKIAGKAFLGATATCLPDIADLTKRFREIQALADAELAAIQKRREAA